MKSPEEISQQLAGYLQKRPEVVFAFLFGSFAKSSAGKRSDVDIGVFLEPGIKQSEINVLWSDLEKIASRQVDLVVLNQAKPTLAWTVIRGKPLVIKDFQQYLNFMLKVSQEAEDYQKFLFDFWRWRRKLEKAG